MEVVESGVNGFHNINFNFNLLPCGTSALLDLGSLVKQLCFGEITQRAWTRKAG